MALTSIVVKFIATDSGSIMRLRVPAPLSLEKLTALAAQVSGPEPTITMKYKDDEDDLCMLTADTFEDFRLLVEEQPVVRIHTAPASKGRVAASGTVLPATSALGGYQQGAAGICGPKPLLLALRYLHSGIPGAWNALDTAVLLLAFLPTLQQRAARKQDKFNAQGPTLVPLLLPSLQALDRELAAWPDTAWLRLRLGRLLTGEATDLGSFVCLLCALLRKLPFQRQKAAMAAWLPELIVKGPQLVAELLGVGEEAAPEVPTVPLKELTSGQHVHFKCLSRQSGNLRVRKDGAIEGTGGTGNRATWRVQVIREHEGLQVVTLCAYADGKAHFLRVTSPDKEADGRGQGANFSHFVVTPEAGGAVSLRSAEVAGSVVSIGSDGKALAAKKTTEAGDEGRFLLMRAKWQQPPVPQQQQPPQQKRVAADGAQESKVQNGPPSEQELPQSAVQDAVPSDPKVAEPGAPAAAPQAAPAAPAAEQVPRSVEEDRRAP